MPPQVLSVFKSPDEIRLRKKFVDSPYDSLSGLTILAKLVMTDMLLASALGTVNQSLRHTY